MRTIPPGSAVDWADEHFYLSPESSNVEGRWTTAPYQVVPLNLIGNDDVEELYWKKSARIGYTKIMIIGGAFLTIVKKRKGLTYQPTDDDAKDFVQDEVETAIRDVKPLREACKDFGKKSRDNKALKKVFDGTIWDFKGGKSPKNYRRMTKDFVQVDEANGFDWEVGHEGDPMALAKTRLIGSPFPKFVVGTTPTVTGRSHIAKLQAQASVHLTMYLPCPHCGQLQPLRFGGKDTDFGFKYLKDDKGNLIPGSAVFMCEHSDCHALIEFGELEAIQRKGCWRNTEGSVITYDGLTFFNEQLDVIPTPKKIAIDLWAAYSLHDGWDRLAERHIAAVKNPLTLKKFINTDLGQDWEDKLSELQDWQLLARRRERYQSQIPDGVVYITGGIDTQDNRVEFYVFGWGADYECWLLWHTAIMGRPDDPDVKKACREELFRTFEDCDGQYHGVNRWCWDSQGHFHSTVIEASIKYGIRWVIPVHGSPNYGKPIASMPKEKRSNKTYATEVGTDTAKEWVYSHFGIEQNAHGPTPGYIHLPLDEAICSDDVCKQFFSEVRTVKYVKGRRNILWDAEGRRNEALDCLVYALAALNISLSRMGADLNRLTAEREQMRAPKKIIHKAMGEKVESGSDIKGRMAALGKSLGSKNG